MRGPFTATIKTQSGGPVGHERSEEHVRVSAVGDAQVQLGELKQGVSGVDFGPTDRGKGLLLRQDDLTGWPSCRVFLLLPWGQDTTGEVLASSECERTGNLTPAKVSLEG